MPHSSYAAGQQIVNKLHTMFDILHKMYKFDGKVLSRP